jgi:hypothetical protein
MSTVLVKIGIWVWGSATLLLAAATFVFLIAAACYIRPSGANAEVTTSAPNWMPSVYLVLKDHNRISLWASQASFLGLSSSNHESGCYHPLRFT